MEHKNLSDKVSARIRQDILDGKYKAGEKIPAEPELMKAYEVGRSSIREAIKSLAMSGILKVQQGSGTFVNEVQPLESMEQRLRVASFDEINAVRKLLDLEIVKLAAEHHTPEQIDDINRQLILRKQAIIDEDRQACMNADIAFHMSIASASHNSVLTALYQNFTHTIRTFFSAREPNGIGHFAISHHLHEALYLAIKSKKKKQAVEIMDQILENNY